MYEDLIKSLIAPLVAVITAAVTSRLQGDTYEKWISVLVGATVWWSLLILYDLVFNRSKRKFTGEWIGLIEKDDNLYLSFFSIKYSWLTARYKLKGVSYSENGIFHSSWNSTWIEFKSEQEQVNYVYEGKVHQKSGLIGFGNLSFTTIGGSKRPLHGNGYFVDMGVVPIRCEYFFYKYDKALSTSLIGSQGLDTPEAIASFITIYKKNYPARIKQIYEDAPSPFHTGRMVKNRHPLLAVASRPSRSNLVSPFLEANHLKNVYRQGWLNNGIPAKKCESVADHSYSVALYALLISKLRNYSNSRTTKLVAMALLHDLGEIYAGDTVPGEISDAEKHIREFHGLSRIVSKFPKCSDWLLETWQEFSDQTSADAKLVKALDLLDMQIQACVYELNDYGDLSSFCSNVVDFEESGEGSDIIEIFKELHLIRHEIRGLKKRWSVVD